MLVAFRTSDDKFITSSANFSLDLSGTKIGSKQTFTLIATNASGLADGDAVKIRYTPNGENGPDIKKASYWFAAGSGLKRSHDICEFKIKLVDTQYAFETADGKFVAEPDEKDGPLTLTESEDDALLVSLVDVKLAKKASSSKSAKKPAAE